VKSKLLSWGSKGVLTLVDQGLIGSSNFLIGILLARQLVPAQYGAYALAFEIFMVVSMAYSCLILEPMLVFGPSSYKENFRSYLGGLLWLHLACALATAIVLGGLAWIVHDLHKFPGLSTALVGAMLAVPSVLFFWLARRSFYVRLDPKSAVIGGALYGIVLLGGAFLFYRLQLLTPFAAFMLMTAGAIVAGIFMILRIKPKLALRPKDPPISEVISKHWTYGRWALAASLAAWVSGNIYYILLTSMRGLADTGGFKALQNFTSPIGQVFAALTLLTLPYTARAYRENGSAGVERVSWFLTPLYAGGTVAYWVVFLILKHPIQHFLYGNKYLDIAYLIPAIALGSVLRLATVVPVMSLKAIQSPFHAFITFLFSDIVACAVGVPAIWAYGLKGAIWAYDLSGAAGLLAGLILVHRMAHRKSPPTIAVPVPAIEPLLEFQAEETPVLDN
jgi:O-antigen/teichoic acid export membrane protein